MAHHHVLTRAYRGAAAVGLAVGLAGVLTVTGCGSTAPPNTGGTTASNPAINVDLGEYAIGIDRSVVPAGTVTFNVSNDGVTSHEMVLLKSDLAAGALPIGADGKALENAEGIEHVGEVDVMGAGKHKTLTISLKPGSYVLICNVPGHYHLGMETRLTVG